MSLSRSQQVLIFIFILCLIGFGIFIYWSEKNYKGTSTPIEDDPFFYKDCPPGKCCVQPPTYEWVKEQIAEEKKVLKGGMRICPDTPEDTVKCMSVAGACVGENECPKGRYHDYPCGYKKDGTTECEGYKCPSDNPKCICGNSVYCDPEVWCYWEKSGTKIKEKCNRSELPIELGMYGYVDDKKCSREITISGEANKNACSMACQLKECQTYKNCPTKECVECAQEKCGGSVTAQQYFNCASAACPIECKDLNYLECSRGCIAPKSDKYKHAGNWGKKCKDACNEIDNEYLPYNKGQFNCGMGVFDFMSVSPKKDDISACQGSNSCEFQMDPNTYHVKYRCVDPEWKMA
jgi:hypothetical protein